PTILPAPPLTVNVVDTPLRVFPKASVTLTTNGLVNWLPVVPVCASPLTFARVVATPGLPVALNVSGLPDSPDADAGTTCGPLAVPKVRVVEACPEELVVAVVVERLPLPDVIVKVTLTPAAAVPELFVTYTTNG